MIGRIAMSRDELLEVLRGIKVLANVMGDADDAWIYVDILNEIYVLADRALGGTNVPR
jgi:hypothetical protein